MSEVNKRNAARQLIEVYKFKGSKSDMKVVKAAETRTSEKDGVLQSKDRVTIADSSYAEITVPTVCLALSLFNCQNCTLIVDRIMTILEIVNCKNITVKLTVPSKNVDISKSSDILLDFTEAQEIEPLKDINIVTESWSQVKIGYKQGDKMIERSVPTKIDHKVGLNEKGELEIVTSPSALA